MVVKLLSAYEKKQKKYARLTQKSSLENCTQTLQHFLNFFEDGHVFVIDRPSFSEKKLENIKKKVRSAKKSPEKLNQLLSKVKNEKGLQGQWTDGTSVIAIVKEKNKYNAYILTSNNPEVQPGELKATFSEIPGGYEGAYYPYDYQKRYGRANVYKQGLQMKMGGEYWKRVRLNEKINIHDFSPDDIIEPTIVQLDHQNTLVTFPSFRVSKPVIDSIIEAHHDLLVNTTNLIVDIRGNTGGNAVYFNLIPYFSSRPLPGSQGHVLASEDNLKYFQRSVRWAPDIYEPLVKSIEENMGKIVDGPKYPGHDIPHFSTKIENVAILTDEACMSAAESFIIHSRRTSDKIKIFGSPTGGVIDYTSVNVVILPSCDQNILFGYPTGTLHKDIPDNGFNKTGIVPDVPIPDKIDDKIKYIVDYFK